MCGIFGYIQNSSIAARDILESSRLIKHRGPDDEGFLVLDANGISVWGGAATPPSVYARGDAYAPQKALEPTVTFQAGVVLGHRRLSIVDLSPAGHQPMNYADRFWLVYNGEIYNYIELREELIELGYAFESGNDSEVVLAAYAEWREACLSRFNGMWSLAILDRAKNTLFLARDRFGVKPLYYWQTAGRFAFASEIKAFSAFSDWSPRVNIPRLVDFLVWTVTDHTSETMFEGIYQLPGGHYATIDLSDCLAASAGLVAKRWYELRPGRTMAGKDAEDALRLALEEAVKLRLRADVAVGSCLSGGLDSSSIVAVMANYLRRVAPDMQVKTFTARSDDKGFDEWAFADLVVSATNADAHTVVPDTARLFDELDQLIWHQDEPFVSTSIFAQWCVFALARQHGVTVMLDGQGADEILGGYRGFFGANLGRLMRSGRLWQWLKEVSLLRRHAGFSFVRSVGYTTVYSFPKLASLIGRFDNRAYGDIGWLATSLRDAARRDPLEAAGARSNSVTGMSLAQVKATNLPMLLRWEDRNSMAFGVEARVPFLDYRLVELALGVSEDDKVGGGVAKGVLRRAMKGVVPEGVLERKDKMGFVTAEASWIKGELGGRFRAKLAEAIELLPDVLDRSLLTQFDEVVGGQRKFDHRYWRAIIVGQWVQKFNIAVQRRDRNKRSRYERSLPVDTNDLALVGGHHEPARWRFPPAAMVRILPAAGLCGATLLRCWGDVGHVGRRA